MRWPWFKKKANDEKEAQEESKYSSSEKSKTSKLPLLTGVGSAAAGLAAALLGDPTFGIATAAVIGAIIGLTGTAHSYITGTTKENTYDPEERIVVELMGIHQTLRAILLMTIFGSLAYGVKSGIDLLSKQFQIIGDNPLIFIAVVLSLVYFFIAKKVR